MTYDPVLSRRTLLKTGLCGLAALAFGNSVSAGGLSVEEVRTRIYRLENVDRAEGIVEEAEKLALNGKVNEASRLMWPLWQNYDKNLNDLFNQGFSGLTSTETSILADSFGNYGACAQMYGQSDVGLKAIEAGLKIRPQDPILLYTHGALLLLKGGQLQKKGNSKSSTYFIQANKELRKALRLQDKKEKREMIQRAIAKVP